MTNSMRLMRLKDDCGGAGVAGMGQRQQLSLVWPWFEVLFSRRGGIFYSSGLPIAFGSYWPRSWLG